MKQNLLSIVLVCSSLFLVAPLRVEAQESGAIYRCANNEYTNQIKGRTDCKRVEGGNITVVGGGMPPERPSVKRTMRPTEGPRMDSPEQRARDADAKIILESELRKTQAQQDLLLKQYNNGQPDKQGDEARNYQKYLDRVSELKAQIDRNQADLEGIKRELSHTSP